MIERWLCVYAVCHICVFEKKCCLSVQNTELQLKNLTCHLLIMCLILLINVHEAVLTCSKYVWLPCGYHCSKPLLKCGYRMATHGYQYLIPMEKVWLPESLRKKF